MEIRLTAPETLELTMKDSRVNWDKLKLGIGKLSLYEMKKCGMTTDEIKVLSEFHTELSRLLLVTEKS